MGWFERDRMNLKIPIIVSIVFGVGILIAGICLITTAGPYEIPLWFGVTLCPLSTDPSVYISQNLPQAGACPAVLTANNSQIQEFSIAQSLFSPDGLTYHPVIYRTSESATVQFKLADADGNLLLAEGPLTVTNNDVATKIAIPYTKEEVDDDPSHTPSMRKLMKGGRGSYAGASYTRTGTNVRFGSSSVVRNTRYGYYSCCINTGYVVAVYRPGPLTRNGYYDTDNSDHSNCGDPKSGCSFEVANNMNRDEFSFVTITADKSLKYPLKLTLIHAQVPSPSGEPQLYFTFWTDEPDNKRVASYLLLPLGCLFIVIPVIIAIVRRFRR